MNSLAFGVGEAGRVQISAPGQLIKLMKQNKSVQWDTAAITENKCALMSWKIRVP